MDTISIAVVMNHISTIKPHKDSTFAMLLEAQARAWQITHITIDQLFLAHDEPMALCQSLQVFDDPQHWFQLGAVQMVPLEQFDIILMRQDPPFDMTYIYATYMLEHAQRKGCYVMNHPQALRDANEKMYTTWFPQCCPPLLISANAARIKAFLAEHQQAVIKPLGGMGGESIFKLNQNDANTNVIIETLTQHGSQFAMIQRYIPQITQGDKRILLIDGEPVPYALARIPTEGEFRGNIAVGGTGVGQPLSAQDRWLCEQIGPTLKEKGLMFVGIDVIGDYLTEINVTSPTCIRELDKQFSLNICAELMDRLQAKIRP